MRWFPIFWTVSAAADAVLATSQLRSRKQHTQTVIYWGQNGGSAVENNDLASYCTPESGIDIILLAFLYKYGNGKTIASGTIGQSCYISPSGKPQNCENLAAAIEICKTNGVKVILSLGGASGAYSLSSREEAETIGQNLWEAYGNTSRRAVPRPFGNTFLDGWDFDIEASPGNKYYQYLIDKLRRNFASDPINTYYITGAPQCPIPEPHMQMMITNSEFDYLWVQFYNNPQCSVNGVINYDGWVSNIANTSSKNARFFIGIPASPLAATGTSSGTQYYLNPSDLAELVKKYIDYPTFGGVMIWSAAFSDANSQNGETYAQHVKQILNSASHVPC
ncbi:chitinase 2 [Penicillium riverlandense]|uniref:chitinase 2 n=1 Tax=Penicillium riverlandense TaxID=1903569 RepID=UPI002548D39B|nr:chitinase 2 [Penicillium riverlandense]KAJ5819509.1 chitinase 2 [Penicillium riverlandense]